MVVSGILFANSFQWVAALRLDLRCSIDLLTALHACSLILSDSKIILELVSADASYNSCGCGVRTTESYNFHCSGYNGMLLFNSVGKIYGSPSNVYGFATDLRILNPEIVGMGWKVSGGLSDDIWDRVRTLESSFFFFRFWGRMQHST